jgi:hypothetical protein
MTEHQNGGKMFFASIVMESGQVIKGFWNTNTKVATKHPFIQT